MKHNVKHLKHATVTSPKGFLADGVNVGLRYSKKDVGLIYSEVPAVAAAVHTQNKFIAAPNQVTKQSIEQERTIQAVICNSACANACTGKKGLEDAFSTRKLVADKFGIPEHFVAVGSTGVIGQLLDMDKIASGISAIEPKATPEGGMSFAKAIMTTDLIEKCTGYETEINGATVTMAGCSKGSGMIHPNMATMLGFITTDAAIEKEALQKALSEITDISFNQITVDGETSTNDMVIVLANGMAGNQMLNESHPEWDKFFTLLLKTAEDLAKAIARDGEGATKLIEVRVRGAASDADAQAISKKIVGSSLVKTAVYGNDANWGRIVSAAGHSTAQIDQDTVDVIQGGMYMLKNSEVQDFDEEAAREYLMGDTIVFEVDFHLGDGKATAWGCDLTYKYVEINASYRS